MTPRSHPRTARRIGVAAVGALLTGFLATGLAAVPASAALAAPDHTYVVNSTGDAGAAGSTSDGVCDTGATLGGQPECTLRAAIEEAGGTAGDDAIDATGVSGTIQLGSRLQVTASVAISGPGADALTVNGGGDAGGFQVFYISGGDAVSISGLTISGGTVTTSVAAVDGGGIMSYAALLTLDGVVVTGNHLAAGPAGAGGVASSGDLVIVDSTISDNRAGGSFTYGQGGGVSVVNDFALTVTNSTIAGNEVSLGSSGGGIRSVGPVALDSVTFADNTATSPLGIPARDVWVQDVVTARNTIFGSVAASGLACKLVPGPLTSLGHNLEAGTGGSCGLSQPSDLDGVDPQLGALGDNGGPTPTLALAATSPAIDAGQTSQAADQRGVARPQGSAADIGAFELDTAPPDTVIDSGPANGATTASGSASFGFHGTEAGSTLACSLDSAPEVDCSSGTADYTGLADGPHTFSVRATDIAGNVDPTPATRTFTVDTATGGGTSGGGTSGGGAASDSTAPALADTGLPGTPAAAILVSLLLGAVGVLLIGAQALRRSRRRTGDR